MKLIKVCKFLIAFLVVFTLLGCNRQDELKNDDYSFKVSKAVGHTAKIFLSNQSGKKQENVRAIIYVEILDTKEKFKFYEKTYDVLDNNQIVWDTIDFSSVEYLDKMVIPDNENNTLKTNFEFVYEVYDNR